MTQNADSVRPWYAKRRVIDRDIKARYDTHEERSAYVMGWNDAVKEYERQLNEALAKEQGTARIDSSGG